MFKPPSRGATTLFLATQPTGPDDKGRAAERQFMTDTLRNQVHRDIQRAERRSLLAGLAQFQGPSRWRSIFQFASTALAYAATVVTMYTALQYSVWLALAMSVIAAGLVVRLFIIQHDCGHGSYFRSARANEFVGWLCSLVTFTPYSNWRRQHAAHHAVWNNLDERHGGADIYSACLTLQEYMALSARRRWLYRVSRHPLVAQFILPPLVFLLLFRIPLDAPVTWACHRALVDQGGSGRTLTLAGAVRAPSFALWDKTARRMIPFPR